MTLAIVGGGLAGATAADARERLGGFGRDTGKHRDHAQGLGAHATSWRWR